MRIELSSPLRKIAFLTGCTLILGLGLILTTQAWLEHCFTRTLNLANLHRAARLQPLNALHQERLGLLYMDPAIGDFQQASLHLKASVELNPHSSRSWLNLANLYEILGQPDRRTDAVRHALETEPRDAQVQWEAANLFIGSDLERGLNLLRGVIQSDPTFAPAALQVAYASTQGDIDKAILAIPETTPARIEAMHWLIEHDHADAADYVWRSVTFLPGQLKAQESFFYFDSLIARHQVEAARSAWRVLVERDPNLARRFKGDDLVTDGDFEDNFLNGGFGWRYRPTAGVSVTMDTSTFYSGNRSLALQFDGQELDDSGISELIPVRPDSSYEVSGWMHAEELESAHGIRLAVSDVYSKIPLFVSDEALGSFPWREVRGRFLVPAQTQLVELRLIRSPNTGLVRGRLWIDDLQMEKQ
jgi:tetratricopeptide (TPR) repeat protein